MYTYTSPVVPDHNVGVVVLSVRGVCKFVFRVDC